MANTPNKGWPYPTGTDFVVDGDNAMRAIAEQLDARMGAYVMTPTSVAGGTINADGSVTATATTEMVELRGVFTSAFKRYRVLYAFEGSSNAVLIFRFMIGNNLSAAAGSYTTQTWGVSGTSLVAAVTTNTYGVASQIIGSIQSGEVNVINALDAVKPTHAFGTGYGSGLPGGFATFRTAAAVEDGIAFQKGTGTTPGWVKVIGY